jgi:hypothetical protein
MTAEHRLARAVQALQADVYDSPASSRLNYPPPPPPPPALNDPSVSPESENRFLRGLGGGGAPPGFGWGGWGGGGGGLMPRGCSDREVKFDHSPPSGAEVRYVRGHHSTTRPCSGASLIGEATLHVCRLRLKCDGTRAETRFRLSAIRTSPFKSAVGVGWGGSSVDY